MALTKHQQDQIDEIQESMKRLSEAVIGDVDKPGLAERVRVIERLEDKRKWVTRAIIGGMVALVFDSIKKGLQ